MESTSMIKQNSRQPGAIFVTFPLILLKQNYILKFKHMIFPLNISHNIFFLVFKLTFEGIRGWSYKSDIAIDNVTLSEGSCLGKPSIE